MIKITKALTIGAVIAAVGGFGLGAMAQPSGPGHGPHCMDGHRGHDMMGRDGEGWGFDGPATHLTAVKTDLGIKPEQAVAWDGYAKVVRDTAAQMAAARATTDMDAIRAMPNKERAAFMSDRMDQHDQALAKVKAAAEALLPSLDDAQKAKAQMELGATGPSGTRPWRDAACWHADDGRRDEDGANGWASPLTKRDCAEGPGQWQHCPGPFSPGYAADSHLATSPGFGSPPACTTVPSTTIPGVETTP